MVVPADYRYTDLLKFSQNTKTRFMDVCENEVRRLSSIKIQFGLLLSFLITRSEEIQLMEHYFNRMQPILMNQNNIVTVNDVFNRFIDEVRGEIEA